MPSASLNVALRISPPSTPVPKFSTTVKSFKIGNATVWKAVSDTEIYPPFNSIDGLGDTVAQNIVAERQNKEFLSVEDLQKRAKISQTLIDKMRIMGILKDLPESSQMTLF